MRIKNRRAFTPCLLLAALLLGVCGGSAGPAIEAWDVWARPAMAGDTGSPSGMGAAGTGAVFMRLVNKGRESDRLIGGRSDVAQRGAVEPNVQQPTQVPVAELGILRVPAGMGHVVLSVGDGIVARGNVG
jgi:hypothetical protein